MATVDPTTGAVTELPFHQDFTAGLGTFTDNWFVDTSVPGQVTLATNSAYLTSGMLETTGSPMDGHGYGTYTVHAMTTGSAPGTAIMLWPGDNKWPGAEIDFGENSADYSGNQYGALHWNDNGDHSDVRPFVGVTTGVFHDYQVVWEPGKLTYNVDGVQQLVYTNHVPADYAHGGMDEVFAFLNTSPQDTLTITSVDYQPLAAAAAAVAPPAIAPTDWAAMAAQAEANYAATGHWFI